MSAIPLAEPVIDDDAGGFHRFDLTLRVALATGDDGARVAHAAALRCGASGDEASHRFFAPLLCLLDQPGGCIFFCRAADFTNHDNRIGFRIGFKKRQCFHEVCSYNRISPDSDTGGLAETPGRELPDSFIGQGTAS